MHDNSKLHWQLDVYCISTYIVFNIYSMLLEWRVYS